MEAESTNDRKSNPADSPCHRRLGSIDASDRNKFLDIPPGRYVLEGRPNPEGENDKTMPVVVELNSSETTQVQLLAK